MTRVDNIISEYRSTYGNVKIIRNKTYKLNFLMANIRLHTVISDSITLCNSALDFNPRYRRHLRDYPEIIYVGETPEDAPLFYRNYELYEKRPKRKFFWTSYIKITCPILRAFLNSVISDKLKSKLSIRDLISLQRSDPIISYCLRN